ncbi:MAG TPA: hypothetical protein VHA82_10050 [Ramlibacter sp.]|uniref:hypothetical protein n=1 Tax=Ramlibacter sp. TaxID=1917967 RepID=UPI002B9C9626|nr:hypothetical protein [Ramlibacter sp.]HVZ44139.1 hypothetical protein [Ramlibacter sp.]
MRFDLPLLTSFALETSAAAAHALGTSYTLTVPAAHDSHGVQLALIAAGEADWGAPLSTGVPRERPASVIVTL